MCSAVALAADEVPAALLDGGLLADRLYTREGTQEVRFYRQALPAILPVWWGGRLLLVKWGNRDRAERWLPPTGWTWRETVEAGRWAALSPESVVVSATYGLANGVWYRVKQGMQGLLVRTEGGGSVVYVVCEPATRYYRVMTRAEWMPVLIGEVI